MRRAHRTASVGEKVPTRVAEVGGTWKILTIVPPLQLRWLGPLALLPEYQI